MPPSAALDRLAILLTTYRRSLPTYLATFFTTDLQNDLSASRGWRSSFDAIATRQSLIAASSVPWSAYLCFSGLSQFPARAEPAMQAFLR